MNRGIYRYKPCSDVGNTLSQKYMISHSVEGEYSSGFSPLEFWTAMFPRGSKGDAYCRYIYRILDLRLGPNLYQCGVTVMLLYNISITQLYSSIYIYTHIYTAYYKS